MAIWDGSTISSTADYGDYVLVQHKDGSYEMILKEMEMSPPKSDMSWTNVDWMQTYRHLGYASIQLRKENQSVLANSVDGLLRKLEFMFREEDVSTPAKPEVQSGIIPRSRND